MIQDVSISPLQIIPDERGCVRHVIRSDNFDFEKFGETYVSEIYKGVVKAWHGYPTKRIHYAVVKGMVKLALYDSRKTSQTFGQIETLFVGDENYIRVTIPPGVFNGFKGIRDSMVVVTASEPFSEEGIIRFPADYFAYDW